MKKALKIIVTIIIAAAVLALGISAYVTRSVSDDIAGVDTGNGISADEAEACRSIDPQCILVLGCAVWEDNEPSPMLKDRLDTAIALYKAGIAPKLLLSGDNSIVEYSEPDCMYTYALEQGVPEEDIFLDFAGFSTYESIYRARDVFCVRSAVIVSQKYHLFRALHTCDALGVKAVGAAADQQKYAGRYNREVREVIARNKDMIYSITKPEPTFLGEKIPIDGDGSVTHVN